MLSFIYSHISSKNDSINYHHQTKFNKYNKIKNISNTVYRHSFHLLLLFLPLLTILLKLEDLLVSPSTLVLLQRVMSGLLEKAFEKSLLFWLRWCLNVACKEKMKSKKGFDEYKTKSQFILRIQHIPFTSINNLCCVIFSSQNLSHRTWQMKISNEFYL